MKKYSIVIILIFLTGCCSFGKNKVLSNHFDGFLLSQKRIIVFLKKENPTDIKTENLNEELKTFQKSLEAFVKGNSRVFYQPRQLSSLPLCLKGKLKDMQQNFNEIGLLFKKHRKSLKKYRVLRHLVFIARDVRKLKKQMKHFFVVPEEMK